MGIIIPLILIIIALLLVFALGYWGIIAVVVFGIIVGAVIYLLRRKYGG